MISSAPSLIAATATSFFPVEHQPVDTREMRLAQVRLFCFTIITSSETQEKTHEP